MNDSKKYSLFLIIILLINTVIILVVAKHKLSSNTNYFSNENQTDVLDYEQQISIDYPSNIVDGLQFVNEYSQVNNNQNQYTSLIDEDDY